MQEVLDAATFLYPVAKYGVYVPARERLLTAFTGAFEDLVKLCCKPDAVHRERLQRAPVAWRVGQQMENLRELDRQSVANYASVYYVATFVSRVLTGRGQQVPDMPSTLWGEKFLASLNRR